MKVKISQKSRSPFVFASNIFIGARVMVVRRVKIGTV